MSHDVYFESSNNDFCGCYLKVNGCEKALTELITDEEVYNRVYNRSGKFLLTKESGLKFLNDVKTLDWDGEVIPDWIEEQLTKVEQLILEYDFNHSSLFIYTQ